MKKLLFIIILILSIILLASCATENNSITDNIIAPSNNDLPITGKWIIKDYKMSNTDIKKDELAKTRIGDEILFHEDLFVLGEGYYLEPSFKTKHINTLDYFVYQYNINPKELNINQDESQVISLMKDGQLLYEFVKKSEDSAIVNIDGVFFYLTQVSEEVEEEKIAEYSYADKARFKAANIEEDDILRSGVLIGLKSLDLESNQRDIEKWNYRTIFIRSYNKDIANIYEMDNIFLPRKTGFWNIKIDREEDHGKVNDRILASPIDKTSDSKKIKSIKDEEESSLKNILYIGNDYISIENVGRVNKGERIIELYPIDNVKEGNPIAISDITGDIGKKRFLEAGKKEIQMIHNEYKNSPVDLKPNEENFGLFRRNGCWIFKGRYNYVKEDEYKYTDFNIQYIPPKEIVQYDEVSIPWNTIKSKVPEAIDAFTSPNDDMVLIITSNKILVYLIDEGDISYTPAAKIELKSGEKPIMAEWAIGKYPLLWEDEVLKSGGMSIK